LRINEPGDAWERDADRVADAVMAGAAAPPADAAGPPKPALRRCACGGSCPSCRAKKEEDDEHPLMREAAGPASPSPAVAPPVVHDVLASSGRPLEAGMRAFMEERFGADFGGVRVHADARAAESAAAVAAHAYAVGRDVVFGAGKYAPESADGRRLIAHELAHVVQQRSAPGALSRALQRDDVTCDTDKCCFKCPPDGPANRCCSKEQFAYVQKAEAAGNAVISKALDAWNSSQACPGHDPRIKPIVLKHFKVDIDSPGSASQRSTIGTAFDKIYATSGIIPDCEPKVSPGGKDEDEIAAGWRPLNGPMCIDFFPKFFDKGRAARAPITTIHEKAHSLARKDDQGGYEGDQTYPGASASVALQSADSYANCMRDLAALTPPPRCPKKEGDKKEENEKEENEKGEHKKE